MGRLESPPESPKERLAGCLEELGYHFIDSPLGLRITGNSSNPEPTFEESGKMTSRAVKEINEYMTHGCHRMGHDEIAPAVQDG